MSKKKNEYNVARAADLEASGLNDAKVIKKLHLGDVLDMEATADLTGLEPKKFRAVAYEIPYFDVSGRVVEYSRWKLISLDDRAELPFKYYQEDKTIPRVYLPPLADWSSLATDTTKRIVITEGEKKAACACLHGIPCLGLGGVWNWKSKKWGYEEIPDFDAIDWRGREIEVCFDGDMTTNQDVARALLSLTASLLKRGGRVFVRYLEKTGGKAALDDFLVARGPEAYEELRIAEAQQSKQLTDLNSKLAYIRRTNSFISLEDGTQFKTESDVHRRYGTYKMIGEGGKSVSTCTSWCTWEHRLELENIVYEPGKPPLHDRNFNTWRDDGVKSVKGDCSAFLDVIQSIERWEWLLQWLAYPVQYPGAKLHTAVVIWSVEQGTGKSLIGDVMCDIYGRSNSSKITSDNLEDASNEWIARKQFIMGEEVMQSATRAEMGILKSMITGDVVHVNVKYVPRYSVANRANIYLNSNQLDAMRLERNDRRMFVGTLTDTRDAKFWAEITKWRAAGGASFFRHYLENRVSLQGFNPNGAAPVTTEKQLMTYRSLGAFDQWCADLLSDPDTIFGDAAKALAGRDVFTVSQLMNFLPEELRGKANAAALGKSLGKMGAIPLNSPVKTADGKQRRLVAVKNLAKWNKLRSDRAAWAHNYDGAANVVRMKVVDINAKRKGK